jgi:hypothetical protein
VNNEPGSREELLSKVHTQWAELVRLLRSIDESTLDTPDVIGIWSPADLINHLETWDQIAIRKLSYVESGDRRPWWEIEGLPFDSIHAFNEAGVESSRDLPLEERWRRLYETHERLVAKLQKSPAWREAGIYEDTADHYAHHIRDITRWLNQVSK